MKKIYNLILCFNLAFLLVGCKDKKLVINQEVKDTLKISNGNYIAYEKMGDIICAIGLIENYQDKRMYNFYNSGNIKLIYDYYNGEIIRRQDFFDTEKNCTKGISSLIYNHSINSQIPMNSEFYDSCGAFNLKKSVYIYVKSSTGKDTFNLGDKVTITFKWRYPETHKKECEKKIIINGFDNEFNIVDEDNIKAYTYNVKGDKFEQKLEIDKLGNNVIRGVLLENVITDSTHQTNPLFFEYNYYVKKKVIPAYTREYFDFFYKQFDK